MMQKIIPGCLLIALALYSTTPARAQSAHTIKLREETGGGASREQAELQALRKDIEKLQSGQVEIQKSLQMIKDLLLGKQPALEDVYISTAGAHALGSPAAKLTIIEFSDYECPYCGNYARDTYSPLIEKYVNTGKVRYILRNFPLVQLHPHAQVAAEAAECAAEQGKYWEMHERLFRSQQALDIKEMSGHAAVLGLDSARFQQCLDSGRVRAKVQADLAEGAKLNVRGTPTFFFGYQQDSGGEKIRAVKLMSGSQPLSAFAEILDDMLRENKDASH